MTPSTISTGSMNEKRDLPDGLTLKTDWYSIS